MRVLFRPLAAVAICFALAVPAAAQSVAGAYLAARAAAMDSDFEQAAAYYTRALARDPRNTQLMASAVVARMALGEVDRALPIAQALQSAGESNQVAELVIKVDMIRKGAFSTMTAPVEEGRGIGPLVDGLLRAWSFMGQGEVSNALAAFEEVRNQPGLEGFALYHEANALASVGDFEGAEAIYGSDNARAALQTRRGVMARVEVLSQLGRFDEALELLQTMFAGATDPEIDVVIEKLRSGTVLPFSHVTSVQDGFAEVFYTVADALRGEAGAEFTILYAQAARILRPDHVDALLATAQLFESLGQFGPAIEVYREVPSDHPAYHAAELGRAAALRRSDRPDASIEVLEQLARSHGTLATVQSALGDAYRQQDRFAEAVGAYDAAVELARDTGASSWFLLYARAISNERLGNWELAESDFRAALDINPGQPQVLNYLGYSLVEKQIKLDEALEMIEQAVAASPDSGYIIDSLGWALYRLRRFEEAVPHMERAVELMPVDPVVNDHLGDVYWAVGRYREAEFQWARALSFVDLENVSDDADPDRIRRKLEVGLDQVLEEEGAEPLKVANDG
ncbi:tetratricopeptide repeat protein [uncultured Roseobacter sp.]|uniref:tetratricopeptide repeat protein n=1 Tax=uncultured Roseobacter sp. TaxID=114847 RepID=UPI002613418E|nr:tetratricopeptide repeat protein [uncultured Roseobacter sp.]